jgi:hypothetical protein
MIVDLPEKFEAVLRSRRTCMAFPPKGTFMKFSNATLRPCALAPVLKKSSGVPYKTGRGSFEKYGQSPSAEEIDANRTDMF